MGIRRREAVQCLSEKDACIGKNSAHTGLRVSVVSGIHWGFRNTTPTDKRDHCQSVFLPYGICVSVYMCMYLYTYMNRHTHIFIKFVLTSNQLPNASY